MKSFSFCRMAPLFSLLLLLNLPQITHAANGLNYSYYEGTWNSLPNFSTLTPIRTGIATDFSLSQRSSDSYFGFVYSGYILLSSAGRYTFYTNSDDGSKLYIDGNELVQNDGLHGMQERPGSIDLTSGIHEIKITYFEKDGGQELQVLYEGPSISKRNIPFEILYTTSPTNQIPSFTTQPQNINTAIGATAAFTVAILGVPTPSLQWYKNGNPITGATSATYRTPYLSAADNGSTYHCVAVNSEGTATSQTATVTLSETGAILRDYWQGITGSLVTNLTSNTNYPNNPSGTTYETIFEGPSGFDINYGTRFRGYVHPPVTGNYTFWLASDDNAFLYLSTSTDPSAMTQIARVDTWSGIREWTLFPSQQSSPVALVAGQKYYIEVLHKQGTGGDNVAVGWQLPGGTFERPIPGNRLSPYSGQNPVQYTLTMSVSGTGTTSPNGAVSVQSGALTPIAATAGTGYTFSNWSVTSGTAIITNVNSANTTVQLTSGNATIRANFTPVTYTLTMSTDGNGITSPQGTVNVNSGVSTSISATPNAGFQFVSWTVVSGTATFLNANAASTSVILTSGNATIRANFSQNTYSLTVNNDGNGTTSPQGTISVVPNVATSISATPNSGFQFSSWTTISGTASFGNVNAASTTVQLTTGNASIRANFIPITYTLNVSSSGNGTTSPQGNVTVNANALTSITATPSTGYRFVSWTIVSGIATIANVNAATTTVQLSTGSASIRANFTPITYTLNINNDGHGTTSPTGNVVVNHGVSTAISATPSAGYQFLNWSVISGNATIANVNSASSSVILSSGDASVRANFQIQSQTPQFADQLTITGSLSDSNSIPVGMSRPDTFGMKVKLFTSADGTIDSVYSEKFIKASQKGISISKGFFSIRLGSGSSTYNLKQVLSANRNLYAQVYLESPVRDTLLPRTPITATAYSLTTQPQTTSSISAVLRGEGDPNTKGLSAEIGTYFINTLDNSTWLKVNTVWKKID